MSAKKKSTKKPITSEFNTRMNQLLRSVDKKKQPERITVLHDCKGYVGLRKST